MLSRCLVSLLALTILFGCSVSVPLQQSVDGTPEQKSVYREPLGYVKPPPAIENYSDIGRDDNVLYLYTNDLNWYMFYLFSYTRILNQYALSKGWIVPKTEPLCKTFRWPKSLDVPKFDYKGDGNIDSLELELAIFIAKAKEAYDGQRRTFDEAEMWQRRLCMY